MSLKTILVSVVAVFMVAYSSVVSAEESKVELSEQKEALISLYNKELISTETFNKLISKGLKPNTEVTLRITRNAQVLVKQLKSQVQNSQGAPQDGDEKELRYEREENGKIYGYVETERYFVSGGSGRWVQVHYSRTYLRDAPKKDDGTHKDPK